MRYHPAFERSLISLGVILVGGTAHAQFSLDNSGNPTGPGIASFTENVDFADLDQDGDWDAVFADGGDAGNDQNRIWMNAGGAQGGTVGTFLDETSVRFPQQQDDSRDIEFADIDNDGDLDIYVSNTAQLVAQGNKWWVNGTNSNGDLGFYTDETAARWVGLGVNPNTSQPGGSSIAPGLVGNGTFIGLGATIASFLTVGQRNLIGAGAVILKDTNDFEIYRGHASKPSSVPTTRFDSFNG